MIGIHLQNRLASNSAGLRWARNANEPDSWTIRGQGIAPRIGSGRNSYDIIRPIGMRLLRVEPGYEVLEGLAATERD